MPMQLNVEARIELTTRCRDADALPKAPLAGQVIEEAGERVQVMFNGLRVVAGGYYGDWMMRLIELCRGHHEPQEEVAFAQVMHHVGPRARMIELGGNWSFYSIWFLSGFAGRKAIVLEPDPAYLETGRRNAALNGVMATFVNAFAGGKSRPPETFRTESSGEIAIPCLSVPDLMSKAGWDSLDVLHCDAQGVEFDVLQSCADLFRAGAIGWVIVSTHSHHISGDPLTHQRCHAILRQLGGTIVAEHDVHESFSGDGLVVARFGPLPKGWVSPRISYNRYSSALFRNPAFDLAAASARGR